MKKPDKFFPVDRIMDADEAAGNASGRLSSVTADATSKLDPRVQDLMCLIFDVKLMEASLAEMEFDLAKMPLGNLKKTQIQAGYLVLSQIQEVLDGEDGGRGAAAVSAGGQQRLTDLSNKFYTLIPHAFGPGKIKVIATTGAVRAKTKMIEALLDIEIATKLLAGGGSRRRDCHLMVPPCTFIRCFNRDNQGVSSK